MVTWLRTVSDPCPNGENPFGSLIVCKSRSQFYHLTTSVLCHIAVIIYTRLTRRRADDDPDERLQGQILRHYALVWISALTLPAGLQLDMWLTVMVAMDLWPMIYGIYSACQMGLVMRNQERPGVADKANVGSTSSVAAPAIYRTPPGLQVLNFYVTLEAVEEICLTMRFWSPACYLNQCLMIILDGCLFTHVSILFMLTVAITSVHNFLFRTIYCTYT